MDLAERRRFTYGIARLGLLLALLAILLGVAPMAAAQETGREAAFFDLDKTVIAKAAMLAFGPRLQQAGLLNRWLVARALWGQVVFRYLGADEGRMQKMRETALRIAVL